MRLSIIISVALHVGVFFSVLLWDSKPMLGNKQEKIIDVSMLKIEPKKYKPIKEKVKPKPIIKPKKAIELPKKIEKIKKQPPKKVIKPKKVEKKIEPIKKIAPISNPDAPVIPKKKPKKEVKKKIAEKVKMVPKEFAAIEMFDKPKRSKPTKKVEEKAPIAKKPEKAKEVVEKKPEPPAPPPAITSQEIDGLTSKVEDDWLLPFGIVEGDESEVKLHLWLNNKGGVEKVEVVDKDKYSSSARFRVLADSAKRAVRQASPFSLPRIKYEQWKEIIITFDANNI